MDIKAYIESGILEDFVLGHVSEKEMREVRCLSSIYTEIQEEIEAIERRLINVGEDIPVEMPKMSMPDFIKRIEETPQIPKGEISTTIAEKTEPAKVVPMKRNMNVWQVAAAVLIFMLGVAGWYAKDAADKNVNLVASNANLEKEMAELNLELNEKQLLASVISDLNVKKVALNSMDSTVQQYANVYWNTAQKAVYVDVAQLPKPPEGKQYQLWVLKDGVPIDQGMVVYQDKGIQRMKNAEGADAFAITLEDMGGKPTPTMDQLKVLGKV